MGTGEKFRFFALARDPDQIPTIRGSWILHFIVGPPLVRRPLLLFFAYSLSGISEKPLRYPVAITSVMPFAFNIPLSDD